MKFKDVAELFEDIERTSSGNAIRDKLASFFKKASNEDISRICYFALGSIAAPYNNIVLGMADSMVIKSIAAASGKDENTVKNDSKKTGDIGLAAEKETANKAPQLSVGDVHGRLIRISDTKGKGSQGMKISILAWLLKRSTPKEARYIARIALGTLRIGVGEMAVLGALAIAYTGEKKNKEKIEAAYNVCPDIGAIAKLLAEKKLAGIKSIKPKIGRPVKVMLAQRAKTLDDIKKRMPEGMSVEEKYDGERVQVHKNGRDIVFFSRRMDNITKQFPNIFEEIIKIGGDFIIEGEIVAVEQKTGRLMPFQMLMQRRRKYEIEKYSKKIPTAVYLFDLLYLNGKDYINEKYVKRQEALRRLVKETNNIKYARHIITKNLSEMQGFFSRCIKRGTEGIIAKNVESPYQPGTRGYSWIKWKKEYVKNLRDTFDLVIVGAFYGRGKRKGVYGALLCACYNRKKELFETICKLGSGFTDRQLAELPKKMGRLVSKTQPKRLYAHKNMKPDIWLEPSVVVEVIGSELTRSPLHTAAEKNGEGLAIRFPRFVRFREDKKAEQATKSDELERIGGK